MKPKIKSKTLWLNGLIVVISPVVAAAPALVPDLGFGGPVTAGILLIVALANGLLRLVTTEGLE